MRLLLITIILCIGLAACGQMGPLYIPQDETMAPTASEPEPTADPAAPSTE
ncbi:LPS translocon maturation chaperone LptM [Candidatus Litorirhabdus singularis]|uniref:LPS translocon maturation chaperone LptM n=1 Tax=Candidatus Litorirhabdus singularis TaxID=2518993 RepID=UPI003B967EA1